MRKPIIKAGDKYGRLTAIRFSHKGKNNRPYWLFQCDCGNTKVISTNLVKNNKTKSCGCLNDGHPTHRMKGTRIYRSWQMMKNRCLNKNSEDWKDYGGRGIKVCKRWMKFENFYVDMGERPEDTSIDRIKVDGNYNKNNCRWATPKEQANNKRNNKK